MARTDARTPGASLGAYPKLSRERLRAPLWHTVLLVLILLAIVAGGAGLQSHAPAGGSIAQAPASVAPLYVSVIVVEWGLVGFVWFGLRLRGSTLRELIGGRWKNARAVLFDVVVASGFWLVWEAIGRAMHALLGPSQAGSINVLLPRSALEIGLWIAVCLSAGFGEEVVYRGYLQKQIHAVSNSVAIAVLGQALLFGASHAYQGTKQVVVITTLGVVYGLLPLWRKSLRPNMIAHAWSDLFSGLLSS